MTSSYDPGVFRRINLNMLYSLHAILNSDSLSRAAEMVSLTQPAISQALKKLREIFDDDLFYVEAGDRRLTPMALALKPKVERVLLEARETFATKLGFEPATSTRTFTIAAPASILTMFLGPQVARLRRIAPGIRLAFVKLDNMQQGQPIESGIDVRVSPEVGGGKSEANRRILYADHVVCLAWQGNEKFDDIITPEQLATADLVGGEGGLLPQSLLAGSISDLVRKRGFAITTDSLASVPAMLEGTDLLALMPSWLAQYYAAFHPLKLISLASEQARMIQILAQWHPRHADDPAIMWLLDQLETGARRLTGGMTLLQPSDSNIS